MGRIALTLILLGAGGALADEWRDLDGPAIQRLLTGRTVDYATAWQDFRASGRTLYNAGQDSWGYWAVRGDQYCSQWPPSGLWDCYDMQGRGQAGVRFVGSDGSVTEGRLRAAK